jgi:hypothetical protein
VQMLLKGGCLDACDELGGGIGVCGEDGGAVGIA